MKTKLPIKPFLKWTGNKHNLLSYILPHIPAGKRLIEPFAGSCAVSLATDFPSYLLADNNYRLIELYRVLLLHHEYFISEVSKLFTGKYNNRTSYYDLVEEYNCTKDSIRAAEIFVYLNRHSLKGRYRCSNDGKFKVPFGNYHTPYFPAAEMRQFVGFFGSRDVKFVKTSFIYLFLFEAIGKGDVIYADPPSITAPDQPPIVGYGGEIYTEITQQNLIHDCMYLEGQGATVLVSDRDNAACRDLHRSAKKIISFPARKTVSATPARMNALLAFYGKSLSSVCIAKPVGKN